METRGFLNQMLPELMKWILHLVLVLILRQVLAQKMIFLWYLTVLFKAKSLACTCFLMLQEAKQTNLRLFTGLYSTEHTKSSAVTGSPFWSLATTIFPSLSFISWRLVVSARMAIISLATAISNWACKVEMRIMNQIKVSWSAHRGSPGINSGKINFTLEFKTSPKW